METGHVPGKKRPKIIEFVGLSGVGKSFIYQQLKQKLSHNPDYLFVDKAGYSRFELVYPVLFISTLVKILRCSIAPRKRFCKYVKLWYFTQVLMRKAKKSDAEFVFIDEGPLHRVRAIRGFSRTDGNKVRKLLFSGKTMLSDLVFHVYASPECILKLRKQRGYRSLHKTLETIREQEKTSLTVTEDDVKYVCKNLKHINLVNITNDGVHTQALLNSIMSSVHEKSV